MLGLAELAVAALVVLVVALVLRLRQHEPAAVARLGSRLDEARAELAAAEARAVALRDELAAGDGALAPLRAARAELEAALAERREEVERADAELAEVRTDLAREQVELATAAQELAALRAQRAEAEAALRATQERGGHRSVGGAAADAREVPAGGRTAGRPPLDLAALVGQDDRIPVEPPIVTTSGAVRPVGALPADEPPTGGPGDAGKEQSL